MKKLWYSILCVIVLGCNYNTSLDNEEDKSSDEISFEKGITSSDIIIYDKETEKEEFCRKFNLAKGDVLSIISNGYIEYMKHGGCGKKCYKDDRERMLLRAGLIIHVSDEAKKLLEKMIKMGENQDLKVIQCDGIKPEWDKLDVYVMEAKRLLAYVISETVAIAGETRCDKEEPKDPDGGQVEEPSREIPNILSDYEWAEMHGIDWLLDKVGGDVKRLYAERKSKVYALMLSYALNQYKPIDIDQADRQDKFYYILGGDGLYYIDDYGCLENYIRRVYGEPYVVTDLESNRYSCGLMIGVDTRGDACFADMWYGSRFVVKEHPTVSKYYYWSVEEPGTH